mmetsp:Transcript_29920/g.51717  ORF Transcript_29920/g.51717 Transcript_29920/m.51717 type:complete len:87 (-) Transcript_29920:333-593(-)
MVSIFSLLCRQNKNCFCILFANYPEGNDRYTNIMMVCPRFTLLQVTPTSNNNLNYASWKMNPYENLCNNLTLGRNICTPLCLKDVL